uniref:Baseplate protein J-like domain-containing protein n=1 Tax=Geobacter metallireducens TaxID=28232 RepID=A0A831UDV9_GEOME
MSTGTDLTRWNRAGLRRFRYVDGNAVTFLEMLRTELAKRFPHWQEVRNLPVAEPESERQKRILEQYHAPRRDWAWEIARVLARSAHVLTEHLDAYANEGFLGTATQWETVRRLVEMIDYHPAPPASASTRLVIDAKEAGVLPKGFAVKHTPADGSPPVVFETLEELKVDPLLNALRPAEYNRNQERLGGDLLLLEGEVEDLKTGEPLVLEDEESGVLRAYLIAGTRLVEGNTEVRVTPRLSHRLRKGYTLIHAKPAEGLAAIGPAAKGAELERVLRLTEEPQGLLPGMVIHISDGAGELYRRVYSLTGKRLVLDTDLGPLRLDRARVGYPVAITVSAQEERPVESPGSVIYALRVAGDWSRLADRLVVQETVDAKKQKHLPFYRVTAARYHPAENMDDPRRGYTILTVSWQKSDHPFPLSNPQTLLVPPAGVGPWRTDTFLVKEDGHLPAAIVTGKPKKTTAGDLAVVVMGEQVAWGRLASVSVDLEREEATLTVEGGWADRGGGEFFLTETKVYTHFREALRTVAWQENREPLTGSRIPLSSVPSALEKGRPLMVERTDDATAAFFTTVAKIEGSTLVLARDLPTGFTRGNTLIAGNVVLSGHGERRGEKVLGSGDATRANQSFVLAEAGVSFVADPTQPAGVRAAIDLSVAGRVWEQVGSLASSGPTDHHYTVRMTEAGHLLISFGDGVRGRRLPTGVNNVRVTFRSGTGLAGNLPAGSPFRPSTPHRLVEKVRMPLPATGGNDREGVESLRENAPATLLTLERAVSLDDFAWLAMSQSSVWQARAFSRPPGLGRSEKVEVVVVPAGGGPLGTLAATLTDFLVANAVPEVEVTVLPYEPRTFALEVLLTVDAAAYNPEVVAATVKNALQDAFSLRKRKLGQDLFLSEVYQVVEGVTGVEHSVAVINGDRSLRRVAAADREVLTLGRLLVTVEGEAATAPSPGEPSGAAAPEPRPRLVGRRGVDVIQGVGGRYAQLLRQAGIRSVNDLRGIDPADLAMVDIPPVRLWEFRTKAEVVVGLAADRTRLSPLLNRTIKELAEASAAELARLTGEAPGAVEELKGKLRLLQIALDEEAFATVTLRELLSELD